MKARIVNKEEEVWAERAVGRGLLGNFLCYETSLFHSLFFPIISLFLDASQACRAWRCCFWQCFLDSRIALPLFSFFPRMLLRFWSVPRLSHLPAFFLPQGGDVLFVFFFLHEVND